MPLKQFICPDEGRQDVSECLSGKCRMGNRCAPLGYLRRAGATRPWKGETSATQCLNGTREEFLKITTDYAIKPGSRAFAVLGTRSHADLQAAGEEDDWSFVEERLRDEIGSGQFDTIELQEDGTWWLIDYKTSASFKLRKAIGIHSVKVPMKDENGNQVFYLKSGKGYKKGDPRMETVYQRGGEQDCMDWAMQFNRNRMLVEKSLNIKIAKLKCFAIPRDGGLATVKIIGQTEYFEIPFIADEVVTEYYRTKSRALIAAVELGELPPPCNADECWGGNKCRKYCDVREKCVELGCPWLAEKPEGEDEDGQ